MTSDVGTAPGASGRRLRVLAVTKLFPHAGAPSFAPFNRQQLAALGEFADVEVLGTLPWFPGARLLSRFSAAGRTAGVPREERIDGLRVRHPRVLYVPRVGHAIAPFLYAGSLLPMVAPYRGQIDVLFAAWAFPDAVAGIMLARVLGVPVVVKVQGSDLNVLAENSSIRAILRRALPRADRLVAVSAPLGARARDLGVMPEKIVVLPNGVDLELFRPRDRAAARSALSLHASSKVILFVGALVATKGVVDLLEAFERVASTHPDLTLLLIGAGAEEERCRAAAARLPGQVIVAGPRPHHEIAQFMTAADVVTLPSWNEGTPNVLVEAIASGRPVVATAVGGIPDLLARGRVGELVPVRDVPSLAQALLRVVGATWDAQAIAAAAPGSWRDNGARLFSVLEDVVAERRGSGPGKRAAPGSST